MAVSRLQQEPLKNPVLAFMVPYQSASSLLDITLAKKYSFKVLRLIFLIDSEVPLLATLHYLSSVGELQNRKEDSGQVCRRLKNPSITFYYKLAFNS